MTEGEMKTELKKFAKELIDNDGVYTDESVQPLLAYAATIILRQQEEIERLKRNSLTRDQVSEIAYGVIVQQLGNPKGIKDYLAKLKVKEKPLDGIVRLFKAMESEK